MARATLTTISRIYPMGGHVSRYALELGWILRLLRALDGYRDHNPGKGAVTELEHSLQTATRAVADGADDELVCVALLHDAAKPLTEVAHGEAIAAILAEYMSPDRAELLRHHSAFQDAAWNGTPFPVMSSATPWYADAVRLGRWDAASFDPAYAALTFGDFLPRLRRLYRLDTEETS